MCRVGQERQQSETAMLYRCNNELRQDPDHDIDIVEEATDYMDKARLCMHALCIHKRGCGALAVVHLHQALQPLQCTGSQY